MRPTRIRRSPLPIFGLFLTAAIAACSGASHIPPESTPVTTHRVTVADSRFDPPIVKVGTGATVTWTWSGEAPHDVAGDGWGSDVRRSGQFTHAFAAPGTYEYECHVHSGMRGRVIVGG